MKAYMHGRTDARMHAWVGGWADAHIHGYEWVDSCMRAWVGGQIDRCMCVCMGG